jgi:hypothetical protein
VPVLLDPVPLLVHDPRQAVAPQLHQRSLDLEGLVGDDGVAVRGLVARAEQRVQGQRIAVRDRPLLLDEAAEDADLLCGQGLHAARP